ncbi:acyl--CoA ligase, partial [Pseudoxanthomonas sp. KAs_5_3]
MDQFRDVDYLDALDQIAPDWEHHGGGSSMPCLRHILVLATGEANPRVDVMPFAALDRGIDPAIDAILVDPLADCDIIYTSGTTGAPK